LPERSNRILFNEWVWLESQMYLGWLSAVLCPVWAMENLTELYVRFYVRYVQINYKLKTDLQRCMIGKGSTILC